LGFRGTTISSIARYPSQGMTSEQQALQREWAEQWTSAKALEAKLQKQEICCLGPVRRHGWRRGKTSVKVFLYQNMPTDALFFVYRHIFKYHKTTSISIYAYVHDQS
jgi:hypothetical protein